MITNCSEKMIVLRPQGSLNATSGLEFERELISALSQDDGLILLIDFEQVQSLDSAGLITLVYGLKIAHRQGRRLCLCSVSPRVRIIFELTQLDSVFEIFESQSAFTNARANQVARFKYEAHFCNAVGV